VAELADLGCLNVNDGDQQTKILGATARAFIAVTGILKATNTMLARARTPDRSPSYADWSGRPSTTSKSPSDALTQDVEGLGVGSFRSFVAAIRDGDRVSAPNDGGAEQRGRLRSSLSRS